MHWRFEIGTGYAYAQQIDSIKRKLDEKQPFLNVLKTNPFPILTGPIPLFTSEYRLVIEYVTGPQTSSQISASYLDKNIFIRNFFDTADKFIISGFRFQATFKFFLNQTLPVLSGINPQDYSPNGLYIAPHVSYAHAKGTTAFLNSLDIYVRGTQFNISAMLGYQLVLNQAVAFDVFTGIGYKYNEFILNLPNQTKPIDIKDVYGDTFITSLMLFPVKIYLGFNAGIVF